MLPAVWWMTAARIPLSYCGVPHRSDSSAPHSARLMMARRLARHHHPGRRRPLRSGRRLRRGNEDRGDVLAERLFLGRRFISQTVLLRRDVWWWRWRRLGQRRIDRAGDRDLHGRGGADEHRICAAGPLGWSGRSGRPSQPLATRRAGVGRRGFILGLIPGPPRTVGALCAHPCRGAGQVAGERDQGKRCGLGEFANA